ncbi:EVE domain-containing protein [Roseovarius dicentrarchi]|uniref:EVE domain-containing protein n=1 Tax=Roseovarius dicentrarchi TaxID=2250573 RepID=UPI000DEB6512|nr:EVE domain-containing protein [Roseovarius dicentrarchi]
MRYWLFKSEPSVWGWHDQVRRGDAGEPWDGVRNYQARNFMREMAVGDRGFFYHTEDQKAVVGIVQICAEARPDPGTDDPRWECVTVRAAAPLSKPVTLYAIKANPALADMALVRQPRLSVQPVTADAWQIICIMGGMTNT